MPERFTFGVDELAEQYQNQQAVVESEQLTLSKIHERLVKMTLEGGSVPPRATKTMVLRGVRFEARVSRPVEVSVDTKVALKIKDACGNARLFARLFRRVESFVLADGAHELIGGTLPDSAPRGLRAMFARAFRVRELKPSLDVRDLKADKSEAA